MIKKHNINNKKKKIKKPKHKTYNCDLDLCRETNGPRRSPCRGGGNLLKNKWLKHKQEKRKNTTQSFNTNAVN
jgi:hypothetical protein